MKILAIMAVTLFVMMILFNTTWVDETPAVTIQDHVAPLAMSPLPAMEPCTRALGSGNSSRCATPRTAPKSRDCNLEVQVVRATNITVLIDECGYGHVYENAITIEYKGSDE